MRRAYVLVALACTGQVLAAERTALPPEVASFLEEHAACRPKGNTALEIVESARALAKTDKCMALQEKRMVLMDRYKNDQDAARALNATRGFVGNEEYVDQNLK